jgi:hypothetical protein
MSEGRGWREGTARHAGYGEGPRAPATRRACLRGALAGGAGWSLTWLGLRPLGLAVLPVGCASAGAPRTIAVSEAELSRRLAERFPQERRLLDWLDVRLHSPRLTLRPDSNRLELDLNIEAHERLSARRLPMQAGFDCALRYDAASTSVQLHEVKVLRLAAQGVQPGVASTVMQLAAPLVERMLQGMAVHTLTPQQVDLARSLGLQPGALNVTPKGVEMTLVPSVRG